jgi:hypothetical protein
MLNDRLTREFSMQKISCMIISFKHAGLNESLLNRLLLIRGNDHAIG